MIEPAPLLIALCVGVALLTGRLLSSRASLPIGLLGAAGAVESMAAILALNDRLVPPTINLDTLDPEVDLDIAANQSRKLAEDRFPGAVALNNSFGFGGHNVALAFRSTS